jgi:hypothetical protein
VPFEPRRPDQDERIAQQQYFAQVDKKEADVSPPPVSPSPPQPRPQRQSRQRTEQVPALFSSVGRKTS